MFLKDFAAKRIVLYSWNNFIGSNDKENVLVIFLVGKTIFSSELSKRMGNSA